MKKNFITKKNLVSIVFVCCFAFSFFVNSVFAQPTPPETNPQDLNSKTLLQEVGKTSGYNISEQNTLAGLIGSIVQVLLSLLGVIFIVLMVYAGYNWMTASGDQAKVDKAKDTIQRAVIGLILIVGAYAIYIFVAERLY